MGPRYLCRSNNRSGGTIEVTEKLFLAWLITQRLVAFIPTVQECDARNGQLKYGRWDKRKIITIEKDSINCSQERRRFLFNPANSNKPAALENSNAAVIVFFRCSLSAGEFH